MCLAVPMKLVRAVGDEGVVSSGGLRRTVNLSFLSDAKKGDYILIHAGFAIEKVKPEEARATLKAFREIK